MPTNVFPISQVARALGAYLDEDSEAGMTPAYLARHGSLAGVVARLDVWEALREEATRALDVAEREELLDRLASSEAREGTLGDLGAELEALGPASQLRELPVRFLPHVVSDLRTVTRTAQSHRNLAGFLAHWSRGYLTGVAITDACRPGDVLERDVIPAYHDAEQPYRLVWRRGGERRQERTLVAVRTLHGPLAQAWTLPARMDAVDFNLQERIES